MRVAVICFDFKLSRTILHSCGYIYETLKSISSALNNVNIFMLIMYEIQKVKFKKPILEAAVFEGGGSNAEESYSITDVDIKITSKRMEKYNFSYLFLF